MDDLSTASVIGFYTLFFLAPLVLLLNRLWSIEKQNRRTADALERIAKSLEAKPLKLDDVVDLGQRL